MLHPTILPDPEPITLAPMTGGVPTSYQLTILAGLSGSKRHVYGGTVPWATKQARRTKSRVARKSRRLNRKG